MTVSTFVNGVLLGTIILVWMWTWWWNRRAAGIEAEAVRYVLTVVRNDPPEDMSLYERSVWRTGVDDAMSAYIEAARGKDGE